MSLANKLNPVGLLSLVARKPRLTDTNEFGAPVPVAGVTQLEASVANDLREIGPTYYFAPPSIYENMLTQVMIRMEDAAPIKRRMFHFFMEHARKVGVRILNRESVPLVDSLLYRLGDILVYGPLKDVLGLRRTRLAYTAGEAIGPDIFDFYRSLGINIKQLYGQTECMVFVCVQPDGEVYVATSKDLVTDVPAGTLYVQDAGGGGGYGPPAERPAAKVRTEVEDGIISREAARELYGVALKEGSFELDEAETARLRGGRSD